MPQELVELGAALAHLMGTWAKYIALACTDIPTIVVMAGVALRVRRLGYVVLSGAAIAALQSLIAFVTAGMPDDLKTFPVQFVGFLYRFVAALIWGVTIWALYKLYRRTSSQGDAATEG